MNIKIRSRSYLLDKERIMCVPFNCPVVFEIDMSTFEIRYVCDLGDLFSSHSIAAIRVEDNIFFVNLLNGAIAKFCLLQQKKIYVKEPGVAYGFANAFYVNHCIYLVPKIIDDTFLVFDLEGKIYKRENNWSSICAKAKISGFIRNAEMDDIGRIVCTVGNSNTLFRYDIRKGKIDKFAIGNIGSDLKCIVITEDKYYILPNNIGYLYIYDLCGNYYAEVKVGEKKEDNCIREILVKDKLFIQIADKVDIYDIDTGQFCLHLELPEGFHNDIEGASLFFTGFYLREKYYLLPYGANMMLEISQDYKCTGIELEIRSENIARIYLRSGHVISEADMSLKSFLNHVVLYDCKDHGKRGSGKLCGEIIYKKITTEY